MMSDVKETASIATLREAFSGQVLIAEDPG
jgi:hypothetical protein